MATVLITGGTGFVGSHLIPRLAERHQVVALARTLPAGPAPDARWIRQDLVRPLDVKQLPQRVDAVIHLAQSYRFKEFPDGVLPFPYFVHVQNGLEEPAAHGPSSHCRNRLVEHVQKRTFFTIPCEIRNKLQVALGGAVNDHKFGSGIDHQPVYVGKSGLLGFL